MFLIALALELSKYGPLVDRRGSAHRFGETNRLLIAEDRQLDGYGRVFWTAATHDRADIWVPEATTMTLTRSPRHGWVFPK